MCAINFCRIASSEGYIPLDAVLPPEGASSAAALAAAREALETLQGPSQGLGLPAGWNTGGGRFNPMLCDTGAGELLSRLLASSQLPPSLPTAARQVGGCLIHPCCGALLNFH